MGKPFGLFLFMCNTICHTGTELVLDSGFCVLKGILELQIRGVYSGALIKKCRYWPKRVDGDSIIVHIMDK